MIHKWAAERDNVEVFPLASLLKQMIGGDTMQLRGNEWTMGAIDEVLQPDLLHPKVARDGLGCDVHSGNGEPNGWD